jgi:hypothetical protein
MGISFFLVRLLLRLYKEGRVPLWGYSQQDRQINTTPDGFNPSTGVGYYFSLKGSEPV